MVEDEFKEGVNKLLNIKGQSSVFDYDSYDWGCLRYLLELWIFLCLYASFITTTANNKPLMYFRD